MIICPSAEHTYYLPKVAAHMQPPGRALEHVGVACLFCLAAVIASPFPINEVATDNRLALFIAARVPWL